MHENEARHSYSKLVNNPYRRVVKSFKISFFQNFIPRVFKFYFKNYSLSDKC